MLEAHYSPRPPRVQVNTAKAVVTPQGTSPRALRFGGAPDAEADRIVDVSTKGLKLCTYGPAPAPDSLLEIELRHPHLRGPIRVNGRVKWVLPEGGQTQVGVAFEHLRDTTRVALMQLVVLELGSSIYGAKGALGFVAANAGAAAPRYTVYDLRREVLAELIATSAGYRLERPGAEPLECPTLPAALGRLFEEPKVRVVPPIAKK
ncbi:MAG: PilZ domain-containing protein [Planctomycetota bacterium]